MNYKCKLYLHHDRTDQEKIIQNIFSCIITKPSFFKKILYEIYYK